MRTAIVTDSNSGVSQKEAGQLGIFVLPMPFMIDGETFYEDIDLTQEEFYRKMEAGADISTSQPSPAAVTELWDRLLKEYEGCIGVKTGFTKKAGRCLVSAAERDGLTLICVTLNAPDDWADHKALLDAAFAALSPAEEPEIPQTVPVAGGTAEAVPLKPGGDETLFLTEEESSLLETEILLPKFLYAPVTAGQEAGEIRYLLDGEPIYTRPLLAAENVDILEKEPGFWERVAQWWKNLFDR